MAEVGDADFQEVAEKVDEDSIEIVRAQKRRIGRPTKKKKVEAVKVRKIVIKDIDNKITFKAESF